MNNLVILLLLIPLIASFFTLMGRYIVHRHLAQIASLAAISLCLMLTGILSLPILGGQVLTYSVGGWPEPLGITLYMDGLAWATTIIGLVIAVCALIFAWGEGTYRHYFYFFFLILIAGMQGVILTGDLFNMFVFFEMLSIASYILIAHSGKGRSTVASFNYLLISSLGMGFFLLGVFLLYQQTGILSLREIAHLQLQAGALSPVLNLALICLVVGIGVKAALIPLHTWLPDAHAFAPHPVSALLSGVMIKVSLLAIWRILRLFQAVSLQQTFLWIGALSAFLAVIWAIAQNDSKKLLAYHSVSQMGFIAAGFGAATSLSLTASFYHLFNHALFKSLLFLSIGSVIYSLKERNIQQLSGLGRKMPLVFLSFLVGALSICGVPFFNGYASKSLIAASLKEYPSVYILIFLSSVATVASFIKLSRIFRERRGGGEDQRKGKSSISTLPRKKLPLGMFMALCALSILCIVTGILPGLWTKGLSYLVTGQKLEAAPVIYSIPHLSSSILTLVLGFVLYLFVRSVPGQKTLTYIRGLRLGLNNSLLLVVGGFLLLVLLGWVMGNGFS